MSRKPMPLLCIVKCTVGGRPWDVVVLNYPDPTTIGSGGQWVLEGCVLWRDVNEIVTWPAFGSTELLET